MDNKKIRNITVNSVNYNIISLLGKGKGGYSYLAENQEGKQVVVKQIHHEPCEYYQFGNKLESELKDYERLMNLKIRVPLLLDVNKVEERIVKQYIPGQTIEQMKAKGPISKKYIAQMEEMCKILYQEKLNIDYYPSNFIVYESILYYIDYECNEYDEKWDFEHWGKSYWV